MSNSLTPSVCLHTVSISYLSNKSLAETISTDKISCVECGRDLKLSVTVVFDVYDGSRIFDLATSIEKDKEIVTMMTEYSLNNISKVND